MNNNIQLKKNEFNHLSSFIENEFGIKMPYTKQTLLESRLQKRLQVLGLNSFKNYTEYLFSKDGQKNELQNFICKITTNKTDFFREPDHFNTLTTKILPEMIKGNQIKESKINIWSAGCSTGEEPYTISMVMKNYFERNTSLNYQYSILGTDIDTEALEKANLAIYPGKIADNIPKSYKYKYLLKSKDRNIDIVKIAPEIRKHISLRQLNFMEKSFKIYDRFHLIFCRNVLIYFDKERQNTLIEKLKNHLAPGGYLFLGHSETLNGLSVKLKQLYPTIYKKTDK